MGRVQARRPSENLINGTELEARKLRVILARMAAGDQHSSPNPMAATFQLSIQRGGGSLGRDLPIERDGSTPIRVCSRLVRRPA